MAPQRHARVRYFSSPWMGNYPLPRPVEPHTFPRAETRQRRPGPEPRGPEGGGTPGGLRTASFGPLLRLHPAVRTAGVALPRLGRGRWGGSRNQLTGGSKGTTAKSWKRSRRGGDEDSQTSQKERAASGEMRIGVWFDFVSFCHNISELRDRAGKPMSEHEREKTNSCSSQE